MSFVTLVKSKLCQISDKLVHQGLRYGVSDRTFVAKKEQPKLIIRTMVMIQFDSKGKRRLKDSENSGQMNQNKVHCPANKIQNAWLKRHG